nr:MAG TPA: hypothetical protein [Bacteriophage sp.]
MVQIMIYLLVNLQMNQLMFAEEILDLLILEQLIREKIKLQ